MFYCVMIISVCYTKFWVSLVVQMVKNPPAMQEIWVQSLGSDYPLEKGMATHSRILAWRIPWTEEPGSYSPWAIRVRHGWHGRRVRHAWETKFMLSFTNSTVCSHPLTHVLFSDLPCRLAEQRLRADCAPRLLPGLLSGWPWETGYVT